MKNLLNHPLFQQLQNTPLPVQRVQTDWLEQASIQLDMLRLDLLHPQVSGNKWFKQKHHLIQAAEQGCNCLLSFGGAWSNHIHALAAVGNLLKIPTIGVIRGERSKTPSPTLIDAERWGMQLHFINRKDYRQKHQPDFVQKLLTELGLSTDSCYVIPEGGSGALGIKGCEMILQSGAINPKDYQQIWLASGTGATSAGVIRSTQGHSQIHSVAVLKDANWMTDEIGQYLKLQQNNWQVETDFHCKGYGKTTPELLAFIDDFYQQTGILLDQVYTGKMMFGLYQQVCAGNVKIHRKILTIHSGGLQGSRALR
ncbi:1-aminocyclopropane-1-carboxylate deaminase/D-cysteine desulfhydrase [Pelagibaculum spongiae]|uniref:1-aminocyclopropane-1-carboxylate deaminase n=1 Tax=Pelagibaculum spongiae TaxID=2080658 RepID=A0A2V1GT14_9GAMM|nr:pyridoxal-phosphate dependent enzyme [Pelagibaculum spongiae]PVZ68154.1 1-aminocyclopropane-1-carboxylate deaminase [Pelagibaculum spongiae]